PAHLRDASYRGAARRGHGSGYQYPHDFAEDVVPQAYAPDSVAQRQYYRPSTQRAEARCPTRRGRSRAILGRNNRAEAEESDRSDHRDRTGRAQAGRAQANPEEQSQAGQRPEPNAQ